MYLLFNSGVGVGLSGMESWTGTGGNELCSRIYVSSSLNSADPTEKIVPKVSFDRVLRIAGFPRSVFGKQATGNASTLSSNLLDASAETGGIRI